jgi:hypothetical protein
LPGKGIVRPYDIGYGSVEMWPERLEQQFVREAERSSQGVFDPVERRGGLHDLLGVTIEKQVGSNGTLEEVRQVLNVQRGAVPGGVRRRCCERSFSGPTISGKTGALRKKSRACEVGSQHRVLPLEKRDHRLDSFEIRVFKRQDLLDFPSPRPIRLLDAGKRLLQP